MTEIAENEAVILEDQLLDHLATEDGAMAIYRDRLDPEVIGEGDAHVRNILLYVYDFIAKHGKAPGAGVLRDEFGTTEFLEPVTPVAYVLEKLRERYKRAALQKVIAQAAKITNSDPEEAVKFAYGELSRIQSLAMSRAGERDSHDLDKIVADYDKRVLEGGFDGITFGWDEVDEDLGGLRSDGLYFVIGRLKSGKSWFLLKSAHQAWLKGENVDMYTLELSVDEMQARWLCMLAGVNYGRYMKGRLTLDEREAFNWAERFAKERENKLRFMRPAPGERSVGQMLQETMEPKHGMPIAAMYIDQLSWIDPTKTFKDARHREVENTVMELKDATKHVPIYCAAQFNREAANLTEMGDASQIGLSDSIGQTADMLLGIYASKDMKANGLCEFGVIEARHFPICRYEIKFNLDGAGGDPYLKFLNRKVD